MEIGPNDLAPPYTELEGEGVIRPYEGLFEDPEWVSLFEAYLEQCQDAGEWLALGDDFKRVPAFAGLCLDGFFIESEDEGHDIEGKNLEFLHMISQEFYAEYSFVDEDEEPEIKLPTLDVAAVDELNADPYYNHPDRATETEEPVQTDVMPNGYGNLKPKQTDPEFNLDSYSSLKVGEITSIINSSMKYRGMFGSRREFIEHLVNKANMHDVKVGRKELTSWLDHLDIE